MKLVFGLIVLMVGGLGFSQEWSYHGHGEYTLGPSLSRAGIFLTGGTNRPPADDKYKKYLPPPIKPILVRSGGHVHYVVRTSDLFRHPDWKAIEAKIELENKLQSASIRAAAVQTTTHDAWVRERVKAEAVRIETESKKMNATARVQKP